MSDDQLLARIRGRDEQAFAELYDRYSTLVYGVAVRVLRDGALAEDVLQELFLKLWRQPETFDARRGALAPWLSVVARNRAIDRIRRQPREEEIDEAAFPTQFDVEDAAVQNDLMDRVRAVLRSIPAQQRNALTLAYFEGLTHVEIAERTGEPLGTIKGRIRSAVAALAKAIAR